jgi:hypothetical protein
VAGKCFNKLDVDYNRTPPIGVTKKLLKDLFIRQKMAIRIVG